MKISEDFIKESMTEECVLVPVGDNAPSGVFILNETAERIYDLLCEGKSREELLAVLTAEYDNDAGEITSFVDEYLDKLRAFGVIVDG